MSFLDVRSLRAGYGNLDSFIDSNGLIAWTISGKTGCGGDHKMRPVDRSSEFRRWARKENAK
jgi:hypothetical protein